MQKRIIELDVLFGNYIKKKHSKNGFCSCCTCGKKLELGSADLQAGHFIKRGIWSLRWNELNVHPQCVRCNMYLSGNEIEYSKFIIDTYGIDTFNKLLFQKKVLSKKPKIEEVEKLILYYEAEHERISRIN